MPPLPLEPTDDRAQPAFRDAASCTRWLSQLQLTNLQLAHSQLLTQLNEFNRYPLHGDVRLATLESLRDTIHHVQNDYAKRFAGKPLPLNDSELVSFFALSQLWHAMSIGYQRCLQDCLSGDRNLSGKAAMLCQRTLLYGGLGIGEHLRAGYEFDPRLWHQLHSLYSHAEEQGWLFNEVSDPLTHSTNNCHRDYLGILLSSYRCLARLSRSQLNLLSEWLPQWAGALTVERRYASSRGDAQPLAFDLSGAEGLQPVSAVTHSASMRYIAMVPLSKLIRVKTILLQQGHTPQQVELGEHASSRECIELLTLVHRCWCEDGNSQPGSLTKDVQLCHGLANIHAALSGKPYGASAVPSETATRKQGEDFGNVAQPAQANAKTGGTQEVWKTDEENLLGALITREGTAGSRVANNQLVAIRHSDSDPWRLATTSKVSVNRAGQLRLSLHFQPGVLQPVTVISETEVAPPAPLSVPGLLLLTAATLNIPDSLIIPPNWFKSGRTVQIAPQQGEKLRATLGFNVARGMDYERVSYTPA